MAVLHDIDLGWWLGKTLFCSPVESYVWIVTKSVAITSAWADLWALRALPQAASWLDTRSGKILKKCEWRGRALVTRERARDCGAVIARPRERKLIGREKYCSTATRGRERMMMITGLWPRSRHGARHPGLDLGRDEGPNWKMEPEIASYGESLTREEKTQHWENISMKLTECIDWGLIIHI